MRPIPAGSVFILVSLVVASVYDARRGEVPDHVWFLSFPAAIFHIEISPATVISLAGIFLLYCADILGGADAKALATISVFSQNGLGLVILFAVFSLCSIMALITVVRAAALKLQLHMSFPLIPFVTGLYAVAIFY